MLIGLGFRQRGISVVEVMIVVALIAILMVLAVPMAMEWLSNSRIRTASESTLAGLQLARAEAVRRNTIVEFALDAPPATGWTVRTGVAASLIQSKSANEGTADVVASVSPNGATKVSFDGLGRRAANVDASLPIDSITLDLPPAVLAADQTRDLRLQIGLGGQIIMCDPNVVATGDVRKCP